MVDRAGNGSNCWPKEVSLATRGGKCIYRLLGSPVTGVIGRAIRIPRLPFLCRRGGGGSQLHISIDGRLFPHDITPPAFRGTRIFYFLVGLHWWPVKTCKVSPAGRCAPDLSFYPSFRSASRRAASPSPPRRPVNSQKRLIKGRPRRGREISAIRRKLGPHGARRHSSSARL